MIAGQYQTIKGVQPEHPISRFGTRQSNIKGWRWSLVRVCSQEEMAVNPADAEPYEQEELRVLF